MATAAYKDVLEMAVSLTDQEQSLLIKELESRRAGSAPASSRSILELRGLGKEVWEGIDAQEYVNSERASWNG